MIHRPEDQIINSVSNKETMNQNINKSGLYATLSLTDIAVAGFIHNLYKDTYTTVVVGKDRYTWYEFTGTRWIIVTDGISL